MIIKNLSDYYDRLANEVVEGLPTEGKNPAKVSHILVLNTDGQLLGVESNLVSANTGNKLVPKELLVLQQAAKNGDAVCPSFLCDNSKYVLGRSEEFNAKDKARFEGFKTEQHRLGDQLPNNPEMQAVLKFVDNWQPDELENSPLADKWEEICKYSGNLVFKVEVDGIQYHFVHQNSEIEQLFMTSFFAQEAYKGLCSVSSLQGEQKALARLHDKVKGVSGGQSTGTSLVSYNSNAFDSYGKEQGSNAPIAKEIAFKYVAALNYLLQQKNRRLSLADVTAVFWSNKANPTEEIMALLNPSNKDNKEDDEFGEEDKNETYETKLTHYFSAIKQQRNDAERNLNDLYQDDMRFYFLGLAPNGGRIGVSLYIENHPLKVAQNLADHYDNCEIDSWPNKEGKKRDKYIPLWQMNKSLKTEKSSGNPPTSLVVATTKAIFMGYEYPTALLQRLCAVIKTDKKVDYKQAMLLKAILIKNYNKEISMSLNPSLNDKAYLLGRLFATLEKIQDTAIGANASIADRYLGSAATTPYIVFPTLLRLSQHHLTKIGSGLAVNMKEELGQIIAQIDPNGKFPKRMDLTDQGTFFIGYYQEKVEINNRLKSDKTNSEEQKGE